MSAAIPDRVSAETRAHLEKQAQNEQYADHFNPWDDAVMHDICGERLRRPIQGLLFLLQQIRNTERSFGIAEQGKCKAYDALRIELEALEEACRDEWRDLP